jgi:F0F1-type ATP synthase membrane subunit c/vacuolar-type H+-ATPase subunit K
MSLWGGLAVLAMIVAAIGFGRWADNGLKEMLGQPAGRDEHEEGLPL